MKTFKEADFDMTFIYPADFVPADPKVTAPASYSLPSVKVANPPCVQTPLSVGSNAAGTAALVFSIIDDACPHILRQAQKLSDFVHAQLLRQLLRYGTPTIIQDVRTYNFDGHPAAIMFASASQTPPSAQPKAATSPATTYAAKVCMFAKVPASSFKIVRQLSVANSVLCFDFTAYNSDLLPPLLYLPVLFGDVTPRSLVPSTLVPSSLN